MENQYNTGTNESYGGTSQSSAGSGASQSRDLNFGSARSDYGDLAYGGLNKKGTGGKSVDDFSAGRRDVGSRGFSTYQQRRRETSSGNGASGFLMLLGGIGIGAGLMYLLDPDQGRRRRALLRDQLVSATNKANKQIGKKARHLQNRAQGVIAEAKSSLQDAQSALGIGQQDQTRQEQTTTNSQAGEARSATAG
jgi:hypothetical protein